MAHLASVSVLPAVHRAPALRRLATHLEGQAVGATHPARVLRLARDCRLRACALELGPHEGDEGAELTDAVMRMVPVPPREIAA